MTKYILAGGVDRAGKAYGQSLGKELAKTHKKFKILSCFFVAPPEQWPMMAKKWQPWFEKRVGNLAEYDYARADDFLDQVKAFDILYFHGGHTRTLLDTMGQFGDLKKLFKGKTVVGSSAGANMLAKNFWSSTLQKPFKGKATLDINIMVHYGAAEHEGIHRTMKDWDHEETEFRKFIGSNDEKIWHIPEGEFITFEVDD
jgi:hypothetical protein